MMNIGKYLILALLGVSELSCLATSIQCTTSLSQLFASTKKEGQSSLDQGAAVYKELYLQLGTELKAAELIQMGSADPFKLPENAALSSESYQEALTQLKETLLATGLTEAELNLRMKQALSELHGGITDTESKIKTEEIKTLKHNIQNWTLAPDSFAVSGNSEWLGGVYGSQMRGLVASAGKQIEIHHIDGYSQVYRLPGFDTIKQMAIKNDGTVYVAGNGKLWKGKVSLRSKRLNTELGLVEIMQISPKLRVVAKKLELSEIRLINNEKQLIGDLGFSEVGMIDVASESLLRLKDVDTGFSFVSDPATQTSYGLRQFITPSDNPSKLELISLNLDGTIDQRVPIQIQYSNKFSPNYKTSLFPSPKPNTLRAILQQEYDPNSKDLRPKLIEIDLTTKKAKTLPWSGDFSTKVSKPEFNKVGRLKSPNKAVLYHYESGTSRQTLFLVDTNTGDSKALDFDALLEREGIPAILKIKGDDYIQVTQFIDGTNLMQVENSFRTKTMLLDLSTEIESVLK